VGFYLRRPLESSAALHDTVLCTSATSTSLNLRILYNAPLSQRIGDIDARRKREVSGLVDHNVTVTLRRAFHGGSGLKTSLPLQVVADCPTSGHSLSQPYQGMGPSRPVES
jgi:hypothetical protein